MRILSSIVLAQAPLVTRRQSDFGLCRAVRAQLVGHQHFGREALFLEQLRISFTAAALSRRGCTSRSSTSPSSSTARHSQNRLPATAHASPVDSTPMLAGSFARSTGGARSSGVSGLDSAPDVSKEATPLGSHGEKLKPMSVDRVALSNSQRHLQMTVPLLQSARAPAGIWSENEIEHGLRLSRRRRL
jgi:hypothetical protein